MENNLVLIWRRLQVFSLLYDIALLSLENYRGRFVFIPKFLEDPFLTIIAISWYENVNNTTSKNRGQAIRKPSNILGEWIGYPEIFGFSQASEISRQYLLLRTVILQKKVSGCPCRDSLTSGQQQQRQRTYRNTRK